MSHKAGPLLCIFVTLPCTSTGFSAHSFRAKCYIRCLRCTRAPQIRHGAMWFLLLVDKSPHTCQCLEGLGPALEEAGRGRPLPGAEGGAGRLSDRKVIDLLPAAGTVKCTFLSYAVKHSRSEKIHRHFMETLGNKKGIISVPVTWRHRLGVFAAVQCSGVQPQAQQRGTLPTVPQPCATLLLTLKPHPPTCLCLTQFPSPFEVRETAFLFSNYLFM